MCVHVHVFVVFVDKHMENVHVHVHVAVAMHAVLHFDNHQFCLSFYESQLIILASTLHVHLHHHVDLY